jgi:hypothetical protein
MQPSQKYRRRLALLSAGEVSAGFLSALPLKTQQSFIKQCVRILGVQLRRSPFTYCPAPTRPISLLSSAGALQLFAKRCHKKNEFPGFGFFPAASSSALSSDTTCCNCQCGNNNYHKTNNTNANTKHNNLRGSPKRWATSTKHWYRLSYYSANGDYRQAHSSQTHSQPLRAYKFIAIY